MVEKVGIRVLTVDDSRTMQGMLRKALEGAGYDVIQGGDGVEGWKSFRLLTPRPMRSLRILTCPAWMALSLSSSPGAGAVQTSANDCSDNGKRSREKSPCPCRWRDRVDCQTVQHRQPCGGYPPGDRLKERDQHEW